MSETVKRCREAEHLRWNFYLGLVTYNFSTQKPEARRLLQVQGQPGFQKEIQSQNQNERKSCLCTRGEVTVRRVSLQDRQGVPFGYVAGRCLEEGCCVLVGALPFRLKKEKVQPVESR